jgi:uncharacterized protein
VHCVAKHQILFYDYVEDILERRAPYREAHLAGIRAEREAGRVVMAGALGDPPHGAVIVFGEVETEAIEHFARSDPYVRAELVAAWRVEPWNVLSAEARPN